MKAEDLKIGPDGWTEWEKPPHGRGKENFRLVCCDCHLTHDFQFRIKQGRVLFRVRRNDRSTAALRRHG